MPVKTIALIIFICMYLVMLIKPKWKLYAVATSAVLFLLFQVLPIAKLPGAIEWNVLLMISGTMLLVSYFIESKMPNRLADILLDHSKNVMWVTIYMSLFSGVISAFIDNVATVLMVAPVGLAICKKLKINPTGMIISIAVSSNLQGAATLVGDATSIMLGNYAKMDFMDFFWMDGKPGIFWAVELGALLTVPIMMFLFRSYRDEVSMQEKTKVEDYLPTILLVSMVAVLILASFIPEKPAVTNGVICMSFAVIAAITHFLRYRHWGVLQQALREFDYETVLLLVCLFVVIGGITEVGIIEDIAGLIAKAGGGNVFLLYTILVWGSVAASAFIDNIPYVATMLPVVTSVGLSLGVTPYVLYFGLLCGATLGGNLTPIGASANITAVGMLKKQGYDVKMSDFMKIGVPFTLTAVLAGYLFIWFVWA